MTGSLRPLQELAACCVQKLGSCSRATKEAHLMAARGECSQHRSLQSENHRTLHDEVDGGGDSLGDHKRDDLNREPAQAL